MKEVKKLASNQEEARRRAERARKDAEKAGADKRDIAKLKAAETASKSDVKGGGWGILS